MIGAGAHLTAAVVAISGLLLTATTGQMFGSGSFSHSSPTGGGSSFTSSSSSSSSSSSGGGNIATSAISQSQPGGQVAMQCFYPPGSRVVWYRQEGSRRRELAQDGVLTISESRYRVASDGYRSIFTIQPTKESDSGRYECDIHASGGGSSKQQFTLTIGRGSPGGAGAGGRQSYAASAAAFLGTMMAFAW